MTIDKETHKAVPWVALVGTVEEAVHHSSVLSPKAIMTACIVSDVVYSRSYTPDVRCHGGWCGIGQVGSADDANSAVLNPSEQLSDCLELRSVVNMITYCNFKLTLGSSAGSGLEST